MEWPSKCSIRSRESVQKLLTPEKSARVILRQRSSSMKAQIRSARFTLSFLIGLGVAQAAAQPSDTPVANPQRPMSVEEIVTNLVQRNLERARALGAYQGTRVYRLEYR